MKADGKKIFVTRLSAFFVLLFALIGGQMGQMGLAQAEDSHTPLEPIECPGERAEGENAACFILHVPADWNDISNRTMELPVMRYAPLGKAATKPPLLVLAGGPGQSAILLEKQLTSNLKAFRQDRELILMDQRGTGPLADKLRCKDALGEEQQILIPALSTCVKQAEQDGHPRSDYSTAFAVQDYRALRYALKIDTWAILATSYGARVAQGLIGVDEKGIDRILFNGPLFVGSSLFDWDPSVKVEDALDLCNEQDACRSSYPNLYWDMERIPFAISKVKLPEDDPLPVSIQANLYRKRLQSLLARHRVGEVPADIEKTLASLDEAQEKGTVWIPPSPLSQNMKGIGLMMHFSILCAEEIARFADQAPRDMAQPLRVLFYRVACKHLDAISDHGIKLAKDWNKAKPTKKPILIFNGALDTIVNSAAVAETQALYPNSAHFTVPYAGHDILSQVPCAREMMAKFLDGAKPGEIKDLCATRPPIDFELPEAPASN